MNELSTRRGRGKAMIAAAIGAMTIRRLAIRRMAIEGVEIKSLVVQDLTVSGLHVLDAAGAVQRGAGNTQTVPD